MSGLVGSDALSYQLTRKAGEQPGTYAITAGGQEEQGSYRVRFVQGTLTIVPASLATATLSAIPAQTYTGSQIRPAVTVRQGSTTLRAGTDYDVKYANNVNAGTATVTVTGKGSYTGTRTTTFRINQAQITSVVPVTRSFTYDGKAKTPAVTVWAGNAVVPASGYSVRYANNVNAGTATVTVTGKGNFSGSKSATFSIAAAPKPSTPTTPTNQNNSSATPAAHVTYQTHVQNIGDQGWRRDGTEAGTHGLSYRLEAIRIKLEGAHVPGSIEYRTHVQNIGWQDYRRDGAEAGTHGMSYRPRWSAATTSGTASTPRT